MAVNVSFVGDADASMSPFRRSGTWLDIGGSRLALLTGTSRVVADADTDDVVSTTRLLPRVEDTDRLPVSGAYQL